ncbi:MAG: VCBS repeat-containing protein [Pseudomonadota bacterium]
MFGGFLKKHVISFLSCLSLILLCCSSTFAVTVTEDQSVATKFTRHTVTGITPDNSTATGFPGASYLTIGDIDNDGKKEIICTSGVGLDGDIYSGGETGAVAIFKRNGSGLDSWTQAVINQTFAFPNETELRDMDGDGDLDILVMDNFIVAWFICGKGGIYWLENIAGPVGDITQPANWVKHTIYQEINDGTGSTCPCASFCAGGTCKESRCNSTVTSYHRARFVDLDGDGLEDLVTTKNHMWYWQWTSRQFTWMEWYKKETDLVTHPSGFSGPYQIGEGGGFLFDLLDIDGDGNLDIVATQFFIYGAGFVRKAPGDPEGDALIWFKNPGKAALTANHNLAWDRHTIDNEWTSPNALGKCNEVLAVDVDNDGQKELVVSNHHHQQYSSYSGSPLRFWPAGIFYFKIPSNPAATSQWTPITIETGNPALDPNDHAAVLADVFGVDRDFNDYNGQGSPGMVRAQDITGDGFPDLLVPGDGKGKLYYYESNGSTSSALKFKRSTLYSDIGCMPAEAKFDDIDGDGDLDVVAAIYDTRVTKDLNLPTNSASIFVFENTTPPTLITLNSFEAVPSSNKVTLKWTTASEISNAGFNIYRAVSADGPYEKVNAELIPAQGSSTQGASYAFIDKDAKNRTAYFYKLEDIDLSGASTLHGPEKALPRLIYVLGLN